MDEFNGLLGLGLGFFSVLGGFAVAFYAIWLKSKAREMRHREHMAMIEKGLVPSQSAEPFAVGDVKPFRVRRESGIMMICIGIALMMFFGLSSGNWRSVWIGGFVLMFGVANLISALLDERDKRKAQPPAPQITRSPDL
jgi:O-antigen ligase